MNLYHWYSEAMRQYALGDIVVMAANVAWARMHVLAYAKLHVESENSSFYEEEDKQKFLDKIASDISGEPQLMPHNVIFISGSE